MQDNVRVQECLAAVKQERKPIVRYIQVRCGTPQNTFDFNDFIMNAQLVENEDMIGTLIETNDRIVAALEMYDTAVSFGLVPPLIGCLMESPIHQLSKPTEGQDGVENVQKGLANANLDDSEVTRLQEKQRAAVDRATRSGGKVHPDLQDLSFGELEENKGCVNRFQCSS